MNIQVRVGSAAAQAKIRAMEAELARLQAQAGKTSAAMNTMGNRGFAGLSKWGNQVQWAGRQLMYNFTLPLAIAGGAATKFALDNEKALARVTKVYGDGSDHMNRMAQTEIPALARAFKELSGEFGVNQAAVIGIAGDWAAAGASGLALAKSVELTLETMILGELEAAEATEALIAIQAQFGYSTKQLSKTIDVLNMTENQTGISMKGLIQGFQRAAGVARSAGVDVEHLAAMLAALVPSAGTAANAGNALKTIISRLLSPTKEAAEVMALMGINTKEMAWQSLNGTQRLEAMAKEFKNLDGAQKAVVSSVVASRWQINKFDVLMRDIINTNGYYQKSLRATSDATANYRQRVKELNVVLESNPQRLKQIWAILQNAMADVIVPLIPYIVYLASEIARLVRAFSELDPSIQKAVLAGLAFLAIIGPITRYVGSISVLIGLMSAVIHTLGIKFVLAGTKIKKWFILPLAGLVSALWTAIGAAAGFAIRFPALIATGMVKSTGAFAVMKGWKATMVAWWAGVKLLWIGNFLFLKATALRGFAALFVIWFGQAAATVAIETKKWASLLVIQRMGMAAMLVAGAKFTALVTLFIWLGRQMTIIWRSTWAAVVAIHAVAHARLAAISALSAATQSGIFITMGRKIIVIWGALTATLVAIWRGGMTAIALASVTGFKKAALFLVKWGKWLVSWPALIFFAVLGVVYTFQDQLAKAWDNIVGYFTNSEGPIKGAMDGILGIFGAAIDWIAGAFWSLPSAVTGAIMAVLNVIKAAALAIYDWFSYINPWATHSPSLVDSVTSGMDEIVRQFARAKGIGDLFARVAKDLAAFKRIAASMGKGPFSEERTDVAKSFKAALPIFDRLVRDWKQLNALLAKQQALLDAQQKVVDRWKKKLDAANASLDREQKELDAIKDSLDALNTAYDAHADALQAFADAPLAGLGAVNEAIWQNEMAQAALRLEMLKWEQVNGSFEDMQSNLASLRGEMELLRGEAAALRAGGAGSDILGPIESQISAMEAAADSMADTINNSPINQMAQELADLQLQAEIMDLEKTLEFGVLQHQIEQLIDTTQELTFEQIVAGIQQEQAAMEALQPQIDAVTAAMDAQQAVVDAAQAKKDAIQAQYDLEIAKLDKLQDSYNKTADAIRDVESALRDMASASQQAAAAAAGGAGGGGGGFGSPGAENFANAAGGNFPDVGGFDKIGREGIFGDQSKLIDEFTKGITDDIAKTFGSFDLFAPLRRKWNQGWAWVKESVGPHVRAVGGAIGDALGSIPNPFTGKGNFGKGIQNFWDLVVDIFRTATSFIKKVMRLFAPDIENIFDAIVDAGKDIWNELGPELKKFGKLFEPLGRALKNLWTIMKPVIALMSVSWIIAFKLVASVLGKTLGPAFDLIIDVVKNLIKIVRGVIEVFIGIFTLDWDMFVTGLKDVFGGLFAGIISIIVNAARLIWGVVEGIVGGIVGFFKWLYDVLIGHSIIPDLIDGIWTAFKGLITLGKWVFNNVIKPVWNFFVWLWKQVGPELRTWGSRIKTAWNALLALGKWVWNNILKPIWDKFVTAKTNILNAVEAIRTGFREKFDSMRQKAADVVDWIKDIPNKLENQASKWKAAGKALIDAFVDGMKNAAGIISGIAGNVWTAVKSLLNSAIDKINDALEFSFSVLGKDININIADIPHLYTGGIVRGSHKGMLAVLGDKGYDEAVIPVEGPWAPKSRRGTRIESGVNYTGRGETHLHFYGDLSFPNIETADDAEAFIKQLEILAEA